MGGPGPNKKERIAFTMRIDQRIISSRGSPYKPIMEQIETRFKGKLTTVMKGEKSYYHLNFSKIECLELITEYFTKYPLLTSKYLDYFN